MDRLSVNMSVYLVKALRTREAYFRSFTSFMHFTIFLGTYTLAPGGTTSEESQEVDFSFDSFSSILVIEHT